MKFDPHYSGDPSAAKTLKSKSGLLSVNYFLEDPQRQCGYADTIEHRRKLGSGADGFEFES